MALQPILRIASSTGAAVTNSTTETDLFTMALPGGSLAQIDWGVTVLTNGAAVASSSATLTLKLKSRVGSSTKTLGTVAVALTTATNPRQWQFDLTGVFPTTATQHYRSNFVMATASTALLAASTSHMAGVAASTHSGTGSVTYALTAQWDRASTKLSADGALGMLNLSR